VCSVVGQRFAMSGKRGRITADNDLGPRHNGKERGLDEKRYRGRVSGKKCEFPHWIYTARLRNRGEGRLKQVFTRAGPGRDREGAGAGVLQVPEK